MRTSLLLTLLLTSACSSGGSTGTGGSGGSGGGTGGSGGAGGAGGGTSELPMPCTPSGFTTAPAAVDHLPVTGITSAREHQAYAKFVVKDGGSSIDLSLTLEDTASDGGPNVPAAKVLFNGCDLGTPTTIPGVGKKFSTADAGAWQPTVSRFVTFEVVSPQGALLFRDVLTMPAVLPNILAVTTPGGPTANVSWTPIPDAGVSEAYVFGWKRLGGGLQSVGFSNVNPSSGTVALTLSQAAQLFQLEVTSGSSSLARIRLSSDFDAP